MGRIEQFIEQWLPYIQKASIETFQMVSISLLLAILIGVPLGIFLVLTRPGQALENNMIYQTLNVFINFIRSIPFIFLLFFISPFTHLIVLATIGVKCVIVPLVVYTATYLSRLIETSILEVDQGVIEAYEAMGIKTHQIIWHVMVREARSSIVLGLTIVTISLIGATAMAGLAGAGGIGDLAYRFGHIRYEVDVMYTTVLILIIVVQLIQMAGNKLAAFLKKD